QAERQPGSSFKPFVYLAALEQGFTPASILDDAPIVVDQGPGLPKWKPVNYSDRFYGPSTLRLGVEKSRNLMTVRLTQEIGMDAVIDEAERFGIANGMSHTLASALGSSEVTLLELTSAYAMLVNGGKRIEPKLIDRIQDQYGRTVLAPQAMGCLDCQAIAWDGLPPAPVPDNRERIVDARNAYQIVSILEGVVQRGTGVRAREVGKPLAGKTGTTNDSRDAWFVGFSPDLAVGVYVGYDQPKSLGDRQTGSSVALPIWIDFMTAALEDQPATPFRTPPGLRHVRIDARTGKLPGPGTDLIISEAFLPGTEPREVQRGTPVANRRGDEPFLPSTAAPTTSGLY
ncbi:MAG: penicillin-binding transpeptidase domain-containing protein, partial [Pseudomonadota bacterium]